MTEQKAYITVILEEEIVRKFIAPKKASSILHLLGDDGSGSLRDKDTGVEYFEDDLIDLNCEEL